MRDCEGCEEMRETYEEIKTPVLGKGGVHGTAHYC